MKNFIRIFLLISSVTKLIGMSLPDKQTHDEGNQNYYPRIYRIWQDNQPDEDENILQRKDA